MHPFAQRSSSTKMLLPKPLCFSQHLRPSHRGRRRPRRRGCHCCVCSRECVTACAPGSSCLRIAVVVCVSSLSCYRGVLAFLLSLLSTAGSLLLLLCLLLLVVVMAAIVPQILAQILKLGPAPGIIKAKLPVQTCMLRRVALNACASIN